MQRTTAETVREFLTNARSGKSLERAVEFMAPVVLANEVRAGRPIETVGSAVYRVEAGLIVEYWIQRDAAGLAAQLTTQD